MATPIQQTQSNTQLARCTPFAQTLSAHGLSLLRAKTTTLQVNIGFLCNQICRHCHLEAGPDRKEMMSTKTMDQVAAFAGRNEFELIDISPINRLRPEPLRRSRFMVDANLGRLARYLRMLGFDTRFDLNLQDEEIITMAEKEKRILLTRDLGILKNGRVLRGYFIRSQKPDVQLREVVEKFHLKGQFKPFTRCIACNGKILPVARELITGRVPEQIWNRFHTFYTCKGCERVYWEGSHHQRMLDKIQKLTLDPPNRENDFA